MYIEPVEFENDLPVAFSAYKAGRYHQHCHEGVIEILMIISGHAKVRSSFEEYVMKAGDYIVIRDRDSHLFAAENSGCQVVSLYFLMEHFKEQIPYLDYVFFACESFDLAKYRNEAGYLRHMISSIILCLAQKTANHDKIKQLASNLLWVLVNEYDMKTYYSRTWDASYSKTEKYYKIMKYIYEDFHMKNIQEHISKNEYYSKSYITHFFKEVAASSFQDILTYVRLFKSEMLLLNTDLSISEIADRCGFSDIKYYTRNFKRWFLCTPNSYRKSSLADIANCSVVQKISHEEVCERLKLLSDDTDFDSEYKMLINPLILKIMGTESDALRIWGNREDIDGPTLKKMLRPSAEMVGKHQMIINIGSRSGRRVNKGFLQQVKAFQDAGYEIVFAVSLIEQTEEQCKEVLKDCAALLSGNDTPAAFLLLYNDVLQRDRADKIAEDMGELLGQGTIKPAIII